MREEADNLVLSKGEALAAIKRRQEQLNVKIQDENQDFLEVKVKHDHSISLLITLTN